MSERERETSNDLKAERLPKPYCSLIGAHDEIELHGSVSPRSRVIQGVPAHLPSDAPACRGRARHIAAVAHVSAAAGLIWANEIGAEDRAPFLGDERVLRSEERRVGKEGR